MRESEMAALNWSTDYTVWQAELDSEHSALFEALAGLRRAVEGGDLDKARSLLRRMVRHVAEHFTHEERLMRKAHYSGYRWHKQQHDHAASEFARLSRGARQRGGPDYAGLLEFLDSWLPDHIRVHDRMMTAALTNHARSGRLPS
jgi:hemerythrin-like metal-binding protein